MSELNTRQEPPRRRTWMAANRFPAAVLCGSVPPAIAYSSPLMNSVLKGAVRS